MPFLSIANGDDSGFFYTYRVFGFLFSFWSAKGSLGSVSYRLTVMFSLC